MKKQSIVLILGLVVFALLMLMPQPLGMTKEGQHLLAVVLLMAIWWMGEATSISITALLPIILFPLLGIMPSKAVSINYTNPLVFLFLGGFMIALAMEKWNFHKRIALWIISFIGTDLKLIILGFMTASAFLSMWISNTATTMMMLPVAMAVVIQISSESYLNGVRDENTAKAIQNSLGLVLMLGLAYSASIGGVGTLIGTPPNIIFAGLYKNLYPEYGNIGFLKWMIMAMPLVIIFIPIVWLYLCRFIATIPLNEIEFCKDKPNVIKDELALLGKMSSAEKMIAVVFFSTALLWIFRQPITLNDVIIPGWSNLFEHPDLIDDSTVAMTMGVLLMILPVNYLKGVDLKGKKEFFILDWETIQSRVPWGTLLLFGGGFALASGFSQTQLDLWIGGHFKNIGTFPFILIVLVICLAITFLTELTSNTATTTMILPIIGATAIAANYHPLMFMIPATISASFAFMLPVATPPNAIVYGSGWVTINKMSKAGIYLNLIGAILITMMVLILVEKIYL
ncbi:SLC13 family permease [Thalassotalea piscium]